MFTVVTVKKGKVNVTETHVAFKDGATAPATLFKKGAMEDLYSSSGLHLKTCNINQSQVIHSVPKSELLNETKGMMVAC